MRLSRRTFAATLAAAPPPAGNLALSRLTQRGQALWDSHSVFNTCLRAHRAVLERGAGKDR